MEDGLGPFYNRIGPPGLVAQDAPEGGSFTDNLNPDSLEVLNGCQVEPFLESAAPGDYLQFERQVANFIEHYSRERRFARPLEILVAEDNPINQKVARLMLNKIGYRVEIVAMGHDHDHVEAVERQSVAAGDDVGLAVVHPEVWKFS